MFLTGRADVFTLLLFALSHRTDATPTPGLIDTNAPSIGSEGSNLAAANRYIITVKDDTNMTDHMEFVSDLHTTAVTKRDDGKTFEGLIHHYNDIPGFRGYAGEFDRSVVEKLGRHGDIVAIEQDQTFDVPGGQGDSRITARAQSTSHAAAKDDTKTQAKPTWNLAQISHRRLATSSDGYVYDWRAGMYGEVYILDSGILVDHKEFSHQAMHKRWWPNRNKGKKSKKGEKEAKPKNPLDGFRASKGQNMLKGNFDDNTGHGTAIAGIVAGNTWGVAKQAQVIDVKVMDGKTGKDSDVLAGLNWAVKTILGKRYQRQSVVLLSLGAKSSPALQKAIEAAVQKGVKVVAAAGDEAKLGTWPKSAIVVGASGHGRERANFSNFGPGVTLFAPGQDIESAHTGLGKGNFKLGSGSSQAAAHAAGVLTLLAGKDNTLDTPVKIKDALVKLATPKVVGDAKGSPNLFLYNGSGQ